MTTSATQTQAAACCDGPHDARWGRPPARRAAAAALVVAGAVFAVAAVVLAVVVTVVVRGPWPLDDPAPADQRDGLLLSGPTLPREVADGVFGARPVVLLFERDVPWGPAFAVAAP